VRLGSSDAALKAESAEAKLAKFEEERRTYEDDLRAAEAVPEWRTVTAARADFAEFCMRIGLNDLEEQVQHAGGRRGHASRQVGNDFEAVAATATTELIAKSICEAEGVDYSTAIILRGAKLGLAKAEIDLIVCVPADRPPASPPRKRLALSPQPVDALAVAEVKHNPNDLGYAVHKYRETLAWLSGTRDGYDPNEWVTRNSPTGHFTKPCLHTVEGGGKCYEFSVDSFRRFRADAPNEFETLAPPPGLYLITRQRHLIGLASKVLGPLQHRVASDVHIISALESEEKRIVEGLDPEQDTAAPRVDYDWDLLLQWARGMEGPLSAEDALRLYDRPEFASRVILLR
jgi:hypothetical protein